MKKADQNKDNETLSVTPEFRSQFSRNIFGVNDQTNPCKIISLVSVSVCSESFGSLQKTAKEMEDGVISNTL